MSPPPRKIFDCPAVPASRGSGRESRDYEIELITPMFGGGVVGGQPDPSFPIRGTSIRGHLQFWWRATAGARFQNAHELFERQKEVWGSTDRASPVEVEVVAASSSSPIACARYNQRTDGRLGLEWNSAFRGTALPYALFPFQGQLNRPGDAIEKLPGEMLESCKFTVRIRFPCSLKQDVDSAVSAWVNLGGIGARTRRGCGSLFCPDVSPAAATPLEIAKPLGLLAMLNANSAPDWPAVSGRMFVLPKTGTPLDAWSYCIELLREFRQGKHVGRNEGQSPNRPGRSLWPEPESIRRVTGIRAAQHGRTEGIPDDAFPRAEFGLPIVFHFQGKGEPPDTVLYPGAGPNGKRERMASPLILKPLAIAGGVAVPLALRLQTPQLSRVELRRKDDVLPLPSSVAIQGEPLSKYPKSPMKGTASGSAIDAFLNRLVEQKHFQEITP